MAELLTISPKNKVALALKTDELNTVLENATPEQINAWVNNNIPDQGRLKMVIKFLLMKVKTMCLIMAIFLMTPHANAGDDKVVYGLDNRLDEYQVMDEKLKDLGDSTVALVYEKSLVDNGDGTYTFNSNTLRSQKDPVCENEPFIDQQTSAFCSGFLVSPKVVASAGHCVNGYTLFKTAIVFNFKISDNYQDQSQLTVSAEDVYFAVGIISKKQSGNNDWSLIELDRPVLNHIPLALSLRKKKIAIDTPLIVIGHPWGLPRKYDSGGQVQKSSGLYFNANLDTYGGNSGSAVINADTHEVEGILIAGNRDWQRDDVNGCYRTNYCPDSGCPTWEVITRISNLSKALTKYETDNLREVLFEILRRLKAYGY